MLDARSIDRRLVVLGAVLVQLSLGALYAWSVFTPALKAAGWSKLDTQIVFSVSLAVFAVTMVWAGSRMLTIGPRALAMRGGLILGLGYVLAGLSGGTGFWAILATVGVIGGIGIGLAYVVPIAVGMRWFPDRKGMITGIAVAGFGFGAMGWVKLADNWGQLIARVGLADTFIVYGIAFAVLVSVGSIWMVFPIGGWLPPGYVPPQPTQAATSGGRDFTRAQMLTTPQFYLIFATFAACAAAGLMAIGLMKLYPMEALQAAGRSAAEASAIASTAMAVAFSLANGIGRIVWGTLSDRLGRRLAILIMAASQGVLFLSFTTMAGNEYLLYLGAALIGFNFGGNFALFPTMTADTFGNAKVGQNYPVVFLSYGVGGIAGPILGGMLGDLGNFPLAFSACGVACLVGAGCIFLVRPPKVPEPVPVREPALTA
ncbi:MAG: OFA family MFS transporter [Alphaproteobacteria bacterium]